MPRLPILIFLLAAACSSGGDAFVPPPQGTVLSGRLTVLAASPLRIAPAATGLAGLLDARLARGAAVVPEGELADGGAAVHRYVADAPRTLTAHAQGDVDAVLFDLETGHAARTLDVEPGTVYDVVVTGRGAYRVELEDGGSDRAAVELPDEYLALGDGQHPGEIVARPADGVTPEQLAAAMNADLIGGDNTLCLLRLKGAPEADAVREACRILCSCARAQADGLVRFAEPNHRRRLAQSVVTSNDALAGSQWALDQIRARAAWTRTTGANATVYVAVVDSGARPDHPDMVGKFEPGYDFVEDDNDPLDPTTNLAHGTSTAGIIAANTNNGIGVAGVHWAARIIPLRAFDTSGFGSTFRIAQSIRYAAGLTNASGMLPANPARVINLSFAASLPSQAEETACDDARNAGALLVAATGNDGGSAPHYPAAYDAVLAVGATTVTGSSPAYSNRGSYVDLAAPGGGVGNGVLVAGKLADGRLDYLAPNGTSFSSPHVAGVAALVLSIQPSMTVTDLENLLITTAQDIGPVGHDTRSGYGLVNAFAAVVAAQGSTSPTLIPGEVIRIELVDSSTGSVLFSTTTTEDASLAWTLTGVTAGTYTLRAGTDRDFDGEIDDTGEVGGSYQGGAEIVVSGPNVPGLDFAIAPR